MCFCLVLFPIDVLGYCFAGLVVCCGYFGCLVVCFGLLFGGVWCFLCFDCWFVLFVFVWVFVGLGCLRYLVLVGLRDLIICLVYWLLLCWFWCAFSL